MNENSVCPIWGTVASVSSSLRFIDLFVDDVDSPRAGGEYFISEEAKKALSTQDERFKARLTSWLVEHRRLSNQPPKVTQDTFREVEQQQHLPVHERVDRLLKYIRQATSAIGEAVRFQIESGLIMYPSMANLENIDDGSLNHYRMMAWSESSSFNELVFLLLYLEERRWIKYNSNQLHCTLTVEGYARLADLEKVATDSSQAFVAMWFDDSMNDVYENGIKPGIENVGYKALRIDKEEYLDKIDDKIIAEIRRSRFLVADFTHKDIETCKKEEERKKAGARGSVYYEAGFADGLNIPVIFTCRVDLIDKVHFDTRQYPHIPWEPGKLEEFRKALANRIAHVIGDGPDMKQDS